MGESLQLVFCQGKKKKKTYTPFAISRVIFYGTLKGNCKFFLEVKKSPKKTSFRLIAKIR